MFFNRTILFALLALFVSIATPAYAQEQRTIKTCLASDQGPAAFIVETHKLGGAECVRLYETLGKDLTYNRFPSELGQVNIVLRFPQPKNGNGLLKEVAAGGYDDLLKEFVDQVNAYGRRIVLTMFHEVNCFWHPWCVYAPGNSIDDFDPAWNHVVDFIIARTNLVEFEVNFNRYSYKDGRGTTADGGRTGDFERLISRLRGVKYISFSTYNRCGLNPANTQARSFADDLRAAYQAMDKIAAPEIRFAIAETSTTSNCGVNKEEWFTAAYESLAGEFRNRFEGGYITLFLIDKTNVNEGEALWAPQNEAEYQMLRELLQRFRQRFGMATPPRFAGIVVKKERVQTAQGWETKIVQLDEQRAPDWRFRAPWTMWAELKQVDETTFNPALNPATGNPFRQPGLVAQAMWSQAIMWLDDETGLWYGPRMTGAIAASDNPDMWWYNRAKVGTEWQVCQDANREVVDWGNVCGFVGLAYETYFVPVPDRLEEFHGGVGSVSIGVRMNIGGDLAE